jgi:hypothetical protein
MADDQKVPYHQESRNLLHGMARELEYDGLHSSEVNYSIAAAF